jgi:hypothetical protein
MTYFRLTTSNSRFFDRESLWNVMREAQLLMRVCANGSDYDLWSAIFPAEGNPIGKNICTP